MGTEKVAPAPEEPMPSGAARRATQHIANPLANRGMTTVTRQWEVSANNPASNPDRNNRVVTSKYTVWDFGPLFLWLKFRYELANQYFLMICILQSIPSISITRGIPTTAVPLVFVLVVDAIFTGVQDYNRHKADKRVNLYTKAGVMRDGTRFQDRPWQEIRPGDIVKVRSDERFPADLVLLAAVHDTKEPGTKHRRCHINTKDLDGENNLKMRKCLPESADIIVRKVEDEHSDPEDPQFVYEGEEAHFDKIMAQCKARVVCDVPNGNLDQFSGKMYPNGRSGEGYFLSPENLALRGCELRNCSYIYGMAVYTGGECKINFGSSKSTKEKIPSINKVIDRFVVVMFTVQFTLCLIGSTLNSVWLEDVGAGKGWNYLDVNQPGGSHWFLQFFTFLLLTSNLVPISLYVSIKIARQAQKYIMDRDVSMAVVQGGGKWKPSLLPAGLIKWCGCCCSRSHNQTEGGDGEMVVHKSEVRTMELNDELGQVTHIFSDKTGTMTCNDFKFRQISVAGRVFGQATTQIGVISARANARSQADHDNVARLEELLAAGDALHCKVDKVKFLDSPETPFLSAATPGSPLGDRMRMFMYNLTLNHTVELEPQKDGGVKYSSASPDEEAFAYAGLYFGYRYAAENGNIRILELVQPELAREQGTPASAAKRSLQFRFWALLPFSSARGMMSVIMEDLNVPEGDPRRFVLFSKGADNAIGEKLSILPEDRSRDTPEQAQERALRQETERHIKQFGADGLRAMAFAYKHLSQHEVEAWMEEWGAARSEADNAKKGIMMAAAMDKMECNMLLQGASAIEDMLQPDVADTIASLTKANIKIYMLTGDKEETAINIGFGVNMLTRSHQKHVVTLGQFQRDGIVPEDAGTLIGFQTPSGKSGADLVLDRVRALRVQYMQAVPEAPQALIVDKDALSVLLGSDRGQEDLLFVAEKCQSVICCRCRPKQKRKMLLLIKDNIPGAKCLAIGDGANDVDMITAANVGVGILGAEGAGAANSSDYKVPQFRVLSPLLLQHGRWNYIRTALLVAIMFYKNALFSLCQLWFMMSNGFSGQKFYMEVATQAYNMVYTAFPIIYIAVMDQDVDGISALTFPHLYRTSQEGKRMNVKVFILWIASAVFESIVCFAIVTLFTTTTLPFGADLSVFQLGTAVYTAVIAVVSFRTMFHASMHHWFLQGLLFLSAILWPISALLFDRLDADGLRGGVQLLFQSHTFWAAQVLTWVIALLPVVLFLFYRKWSTRTRTYAHMVKEVQVLVRKGRHGGFDSVPACQQKLDGCMVKPADTAWKDVRDELLIHGVAVDSAEVVDAVERDAKSFNTDLLPVLRKEGFKDASGALPSRVRYLSAHEKGLLRERLLQSEKDTLVQFGRIDPKHRGVTRSLSGVDGEVLEAGAPSPRDPRHGRTKGKSGVVVETPRTDSGKVYLENPQRRGQANSRRALATGQVEHNRVITDYDHDSGTTDEHSKMIHKSMQAWKRKFGAMGRAIGIGGGNKNHGKAGGQ